MTSSGDRMDRYARRELSPEESRELAHASLDDPELFEELTYTALASAALPRKPVPRRFAPITRYSVASLAAAAVIVIAVYVARPAPETAARPRPEPALAFTAGPGQPLLLASDLHSAPKREPGAPVFRGGQADSRAPRQAGYILLIEDDLATVDLGSLDGLSNGSQLEVPSGGRLTVTTVFRERARARVPAGQQVQARAEVRVAAADHLAALMEQVDALANRAESGAARAMAVKAVEYAQTANVLPGEMRKALERLAALEYQAGATEAAEKHYQSAVASLGAGEPSLALNNLAVLRMLRGVQTSAEELLGRAVSTSVKTDVLYGRSLNNLGVLAELRGDWPKAQALFAEALRALEGIPDSAAEERRAVETNLGRIRGLQ